jgi:NAD(P)-dependent dehydrogenase (short-subunit alcohol dehydrogenase family)
MDDYLCASKFKFYTMKKVIIITGTSTGFGTLMAKSFANEGHNVIATMRNTTSNNLEIAKSLNAIPNIEVVELDVTSEDSVQSAINQVVAAHSRIDVLINNAALYGNGILEGYSLKQIQKIFDVNVFGVLRVNNSVLPHMRAAKDGLIINISSGVGRISPPFQVPYNATKFALEGLVEGSYVELIGQGIETVLIEPGAYATELWQKAGVHADRQDIITSYGEETQQMNEAISAAFGQILEKNKPNPQLIADAAIRLVNAEKGKRPLRTPVDISANGLDIEYNEATTEIKARWMAEYGF